LTYQDEQSDGLTVKEKREKESKTIDKKEGSGMAWWELLKIQKDDLMEIANEMMSLYEVDKVSFLFFLNSCLSNLSFA
jgi:hypothetical protein